MRNLKVQIAKSLVDEAVDAALPLELTRGGREVATLDLDYRVELTAARLTLGPTPQLSGVARFVGELSTRLFGKKALSQDIAFDTFQDRYHKAPNWKGIGKAAVYRLAAPLELAFRLIAEHMTILDIRKNAAQLGPVGC